jgi:hypothetical protein
MRPCSAVLDVQEGVMEKERCSVESAFMLFEESADRKYPPQCISCRSTLFSLCSPMPYSSRGFGQTSRQAIRPLNATFEEGPPQPWRHYVSLLERTRAVQHRECVCRFGRRRGEKTYVARHIVLEITKWKCDEEGEEEKDCGKSGLYTQPPASMI